VIEAASIASEKVASTFADAATELAPAAGEVCVTVGGVVSVGASTSISIKSHVVGNSGAGPADVEMIPTARAVVDASQPEGIGSALPRLTRVPFVPTE
jgi:hypothetical protein